MDKRNIVLSCFDKSTNMVKPWAEAGFQCYCLDIAHPRGYRKINKNITLIGANIRNWKPCMAKDKIKIAFFFPPCTDVAASGARWFKKKGLKALIKALQLFDSAIDLANWCDAPYMIENPVSTVSTYWRKPDCVFQPWEYGDLYNKKTCLWVGGGFIMPPPLYTSKPDGVKSTIWLMPETAERADKRSVTPMGFANAVFEANKDKT